MGHTWGALIDRGILLALHVGLLGLSLLGWFVQACHGSGAALVDVRFYSVFWFLGLAFVL